MHVDLIGPYFKSIRQKQPCVTAIRKNNSLTCITMIGQATGGVEIVEIPMFDLEDETLGKDEYIDKSSASVRQF